MRQTVRDRSAAPGCLFSFISVLSETWRVQLSPTGSSLPSQAKGSVLPVSLPHTAGAVPLRLPLYPQHFYAGSRPHSLPGGRPRQTPGLLRRASCSEGPHPAPPLLRLLTCCRFLPCVLLLLLGATVVPSIPAIRPLDHSSPISIARS